MLIPTHSLPFLLGPARIRPCSPLQSEFCLRPSASCNVTRCLLIAPVHGHLCARQSQIRRKHRNELFDRTRLNVNVSDRIRMYHIFCRIRNRFLHARLKNPTGKMGTSVWADVPLQCRQAPVRRAWRSWTIVCRASASAATGKGACCEARQRKSPFSEVEHGFEGWLCVLLVELGVAKDACVERMTTLSMSQRNRSESQA